MTCKQINKLLSPYLDDELAAQRRLAVESHLRECPACHGDLATLRSLDAELRAAPRPAVDARFNATVMARLGEPHRRAWRPLPVAAYTLLFLIVFAVGFFLSDRDTTTVSPLLASIEVDLGAALAENRSLELLTVHEQTMNVIAELDHAQQ